MIKLTPEEKECIRLYLKFYQDLDSGKRRPTTAAQFQFVQVCRAKERADSMHENAYVKWKVQQKE